MMILKKPVMIALAVVLTVAIVVVACASRSTTPRTTIQIDTATRAARMHQAATEQDIGGQNTGGSSEIQERENPVGNDAEPTAIIAAATLIPMPTATAIPSTPLPSTPLLPTPHPPTPLPSTYTPAQSYVELTGFNHVWQTWNNCGPATLAMNLSYFGSTLDQADIGAVLRLHEDDKNVGPAEMVAFAQSQGYRAQLRVNGDGELMRLLLSNGIPVIIESWLEEHPNDGLGHYRMLTGYDDARQLWIAYDTYVSRNLLSTTETYRGIALSYQETEALWKVFNYTYLLIYTDAQAPVVEAILGESLDPTVMWQQSYARAQSATQARPDDAFAWFNLGTSLVTLGDHAGAAQAFDQARVIGLPWRMLWYQFGPFESYHMIGRYQDVVTIADATLAMTTSVEEVHYWRGRALLALGDVAGARQALNNALSLNPTFEPALGALAALP